MFVLHQMLQLRVVPLSAITIEQKIGFFWPPTSRRILWHGGALGGTPDVEDGIDERPGGLDAVAAIEERSIAAHTVAQERRIGAARGISETFLIAEIHGDVADAHFGARALGAKGKGDAFVRLDIQNEAVWFTSLFADNNSGGRSDWGHVF